MIQEALIIATIIEAIGIIFLYLRSREPYVITSRPPKGEDLDLEGVGKSIKKFKPLIIKYLVKKVDKEEPEAFEARKETISNLLDGISELLSEGGLMDVWKLIKKAS